MQDYINELYDWLFSWGLHISQEKTVPILFSNCGKDEGLKLYLKGKLLIPQKEYKYLGVIFDKRLTWRPHLEDVVKRCKKKINVIKSLAHAKWCGDSRELLMVYKSLILSVIDYACEAYDSAATSVKNKVNSVQYQLEGRQSQHIHASH